MAVGSPVVVITDHRVVGDQETAFSVSARSLLSTAVRSPGYLEGDLVPSPADDAVWQIVCRFDSARNAQAWQASPSYSLWTAVLEECAPRVGGRRQTEPKTRTGPARPAATPTTAERKRPSAQRWRTAVVTLIALFPGLLATNVIVVPALSGLSLIPRTLVVCAVVAILMTWVFMPRLTNLLGPWLNAGPAEAVPTTAAEPSPDDTIPIPVPVPPSSSPDGKARHRAPNLQTRQHLDN
jgi:antibiotic biosynthesis monooxygenase (ABM) superfamily enzyme